MVSGKVASFILRLCVYSFAPFALKNKLGKSHQSSYNCMLLRARSTWIV